MKTRRRELGTLGGLALVTAALLAACGTQPSSQPAGPSPWTETSASIDMSCSAMLGAMRFRADRAQLSEAQIGYLSKMAIGDGFANCGYDGEQCQVTIADADGSTVTLGTAYGSEGCAKPGKIITPATFMPFIDTIDCRWFPQSSPLSPDVRCFHGLLNAPGTPITVSVAADDAAAVRHLELTGCNATVRADPSASLQVMASDGLTVLAKAAPVAVPGPEGTCLHLDYTFPQPGSYPVTIDSSGITVYEDFIRFW